MTVVSKKDETLSQLMAKELVRRVSSKTYSLNLKEKNINDHGQLFEYCLLVGLNLERSDRFVPYIKSIFPAHVTPEPNIEFLCFPDASDWPQKTRQQKYSLVITDENGERKFGYCRRVLPEGEEFCIPLVYCIISRHRANGFYQKVLEEIVSRHGTTNLENFINQLCDCEYSGPGQSVKLKEILEEETSIQNAPGLTLIRRPCDTRLEEKDLSQLLEHLDVTLLLKVFTFLLLEKKVLLVSDSLNAISSCTEALQSVLAPFKWQHTYIPVLPGELVEMCDAVTPYVMGVLRPKTGIDFETIDLQDGIMVDLDSKTCLDTDVSIPKFNPLKELEEKLRSATDEPREKRHILISEAFINFFVNVCGKYYMFIVLKREGKKEFQTEKFIRSVPTSKTQSFLEKFSKTAMFHAFIQERLDRDIWDRFRERAQNLLY